MALTNIRLYEALKKTLTEEAAQMIAEVVPAAQDLATRADIADLRAVTQADIADLRAATQADIADLRAATQADIADLRAATQADIARLEVLMGQHGQHIERLGRELGDRMLRFFVPLWVAVFLATGSMVSVVVLAFMR